MSNEDIKTLIKVLRHQGHSKIAELLQGSRSEIDQSGQYGSVWNSVLSTFTIFAPMEQYYKLKELSLSEKEIIKKSVLDIYPIEEGGPEIISVDFRMLKDEPETEIPTSSYVGRTSRAFISYSSEDKVLAGKIKKGLEEYGLEVFLAHEDIDPAAEWQTVILENLESTDIFIPILTDKFHKSFWTDQESGMAFTKNKLIVPISIDGHNPYGFLGKYQSLKFNPNQDPMDCGSIINAIKKARPHFEVQILDSLIKTFTGSNSWEEAGTKARLLLEFEEMSDKQVNEIFRGAVQNNEIYGSFSAQGKLRTLFEKHKHQIDPGIRESKI